MKASIFVFKQTKVNIPYSHNGSHGWPLKTFKTERSSLSRGVTWAWYKKGLISTIDQY